MNANIGGLDPQGQARQALADAVKDYGPRILSEPALLRNQLSDVLVGLPRESSLLVAAVESGAASQLKEQVAAAGPDAAVQAIARQMATTRALDPDASLWAVSEIARAMGHPVSAGPPAAPPPVGATLPWMAAGAVAVPAVTPPAGAPPALASAYSPPPASPAPPTPPAAPAAPAAPAYPAPPAPAGPPAWAAPQATVPLAPASFAGPAAPPPGPPPGPFGAGPVGAGPPPQPPAGPPPGPFGPGAPGGPPLPPGTGGPVGMPPAWAPPPSPPRTGSRLPMLIAVGAIIGLLAGYSAVAATSKLFPFGPSTTASPVAACPTGEQLQAGQCVAKATATPSAAPTHGATPTASASASASASATPTHTAAPSATATPSTAPTATSSLTPLANVLPSYITSDSTDDVCSEVPSSGYVASGVTGEELCDLSANGNVPEDYIIYVGFPSETPAASYFTALLSGNGMKGGEGDCTSLTLATAADGSSQYCEGTYTTTSNGSGTVFVFTGTNDFDLGAGNTASALQDCGSPDVDVVGFTDPSYAAVGIALDCEGGNYSELNSDFTSGDYFLGS